MYNSDAVFADALEMSRYMSDFDLRLLIALEVCRWKSLNIQPNNRITAHPRKGLTLAPVIVPDWPNDEKSADGLVESAIRDSDLLDRYVSFLEAIIGNKNISVATPRQKTEAVLAAVRTSLSHSHERSSSVPG